MKVYWDDDADIGKLEGKTIGVVGYGNQGRAQALNIRDSGLDVVVTDIEEATAQKAEQEGFNVMTVSELAREADIIMLLIPDDKVSSTYEEHIFPQIVGKVKTIVFASGYAIVFDSLQIPQTVDVVLLAPRMIGRGIRPSYLSGKGFSALLAVEQDASKTALCDLLALSRAAGATRGGAFMSSFREEAIVDLFFEQTGELYAFKTMFEVLTQAGFSPELIVLDMYGSGELVESYSAVRDLGLWKQLKLHSTASQYGQEVAALREFDIESARKAYERILNYISDGSFSREWQQESSSDFPELKKRREANRSHPMQLAEDRLYSILGRARGSQKAGIDK